MKGVNIIKETKASQLLKRGRPTLEVKKDKIIRLRVDDDFIFRLDSLCSKYSVSRSEMIRRLVDEKMHTK